MSPRFPESLVSQLEKDTQKKERGGLEKVWEEGVHVVWP